MKKTFLWAIAISMISLFAGTQLADASYRYNYGNLPVIYGYNLKQYFRNNYEPSFSNYRSNYNSGVLSRKIVVFVDIRTGLHHDITFERINGYNWTQRVSIRTRGGRVWKNVIVYDSELIRGLNNHITRFRGYFTSNGVVISASSRRNIL